MSKNLTDAAVIEFDSEVKHEYQGMKGLRETVTTRTGVVGESYKFTRMGKGTANQKATSASVTPMDISHARQIAVMGNWNAPEYTDIFDAAEVNFDEKSELATTIAGAIGRREDQLILDAAAAVTFTTIEDGLPNTGFSDTVTTNLTVKELRTAKAHFDTIEASSSDRHAVITAGGLSALLGTTQATSSDYNTVRALVNGELDTFLGFKFHVVGTRSEGGIEAPTAGTTRAFFWHKPALGLAIGIDMKTTIDWIADRTAHLANGIFKAGAIAREAQGIVRIIYDETA
jgi:hypothetical protein